MLFGEESEKRKWIISSFYCESWERNEGNCVTALISQQVAEY